MTLVVALHGEKSVWLCTDRRLSYPDHTRDDGCKVLRIGGTDGIALLGYAGLGSSLRKTQPSDWMNDLLKDAHGLTVEQQLGIIADATRLDMPSQLARVSGPQAHHLLASAIVGREPRLYAVELELRAGMTPKFVYTRYARTPQGGPPPRFAFAGSGSGYVASDKTWMHEVLRVVQAVEAERVEPVAVADRLARINATVATKDPFVSPQCIVAWHLKAGGHQFYDGIKRVPQDMTLPNMVNGMDVRDVAEMMMPLGFAAFAAFKAGGQFELDKEAIKRGVERINKRLKRKL